MATLQQADVVGQVDCGQDAVFHLRTRASNCLFSAQTVIGPNPIVSFVSAQPPAQNENGFQWVNLGKKINMYRISDVLFF